jgi:CxxC-x17-CxxC domain-containing protein
MIRQQLEPQLLAERVPDQRVNMDVAFVTTDPEREGYEVTCGGCERTAKLPFEPPEGMVLLGPDCMRAGRVPEG